MLQTVGITDFLWVTERKNFSNPGYGGRKMNPEHVLRDLQKYDCELKFENDQLILTNPDNLPPEITEFVQEHKPRLIDYFKGSYTKKQNSIDTTIEKILMHWQKLKHNESIERWLAAEEDVYDLLCAFINELGNNGWVDINKCYFRYETNRAKELAEEIYNRAIAFMRGAA